MAFLFITSALASGLEISPVRIHFSQSQKIASFTMTNLTSEPILLQGKIKKWHQLNGKDNYTASDDIFFTPPMVSLQPGKQQVFRLALKHFKASDKEQSYRIFLHQVVSKVNKKPGLQFALQISLPIFIKPNVAYTQKNLIWRVKKEPNKITITAKNPNNQHVQISHLNIGDHLLKHSLIDKNVFSYILPFQSHTWFFNNDKKTQELLKTINISEVKANTDLGALSSNLLTA